MKRVNMLIGKSVTFLLRLYDDNLMKELYGSVAAAQPYNNLVNIGAWSRLLHYPMMGRDWMGLEIAWMA